MAAAATAADRRVLHVTGYNKDGLQGFPLHITKRAQQIRDSIILELVTPEDVLAFIHAIEKAEQYFAVKDYARGMPVVKEQGCLSYNVKVDTAKELEEGDKYDKLGHVEIVHALNVVNLEVQPRYANLNPRDSVLLMPEERLDSYLRTHPLCHLVFETRTKGRVLDVDPTVELKKLMKTASFLHYGLFNIDRRFKEKTLTFSGDTLDEEEIKAKLSMCGKIEHVKLKSLKKLAHVTFRDFAGVDEAVGLVIHGLLDLGGKLVKLILRPSNLRRYIFPPGLERLEEDEDEDEERACFLKYLQKTLPDDQEAAEKSVEEVLDELLREALCRYIVLVEEKAKEAKGKAKEKPIVLVEEKAKEAKGKAKEKPKRRNNRAM